MPSCGRWITSQEERSCYLPTPTMTGSLRRSLAPSTGAFRPWPLTNRPPIGCRQRVPLDRKYG